MEAVSFLAKSLPSSSCRREKPDAPPPSRLLILRPIIAVSMDKESSRRFINPQPLLAAQSRVLQQQAMIKKKKNSTAIRANDYVNDNNIDDNSRVRRSNSPQTVVSMAAAIIFNVADSIINNFLDPTALRPAFDPRRVLSDNFAPVGELPPTPCPVIRGSIPRCLGGGAYIRNGPNAQHLPRGTHHIFDGDGMLHSLLLPVGGGTGDATLCSRFVRTYRYLLELKSGGPVIPSVFSGFHGLAGLARVAVAAARVFAGLMNPAHGVGLANTSLAYFGRRLYALGESDLPYAVRLSPEDGDLKTVGREDFGGKLSMGMTAHPKKDPTTGEVFAFRYGPMPPFLTYFRFDSDGQLKLPEMPIFSMQEASFIHDFAVTEHFAIFPDIQIVMKPPMDILLGGSAPVGAVKGKVSRLGLLPKYATPEVDRHIMRWFEVPGFNMIHAINAWEENEGEQMQVVLVAANVLSVEHALERMDLVHSLVEMVRIHVASGTVNRTPLSAANLDFGVINPGLLGRRNRYAYLGIGDPMPKISGVAKLDFARAGTCDCIVARRDFGPGRFGGEPFFVPADINNEGGAAEDAGYVLTYVHDEGSGESTFVVMDAQSPDLEVVAEVLLPRRVPYGFHGIFVSLAELLAQDP